MVLEVIFWGSLAALVWTHLGYPVAAALLVSVLRRDVQKADIKPSVALIVAAHDEEDVIVRLLESLVAQDYPRERLEILVSSDGSTDRTEALVESFSVRDERVRLVRCGRAGKVAAQDTAVAMVDAEIVAFADANAVWAHEALGALVRNFADSDVSYVSGQLSLESSAGTNREGTYWRYELWLRGNESALGSVTAGNGAIYAVRRTDYVRGDARLGLGHDLGLPYLMVQRGRRAVYEPAAVAFERAAPETAHEFRRKVRMFSRSWAHVLSGRMLRPRPPLYFIQLLSHRVLRYGSGLLHLLLLGTSLVLAGEGLSYAVVLGAQLIWLALAAAGWLRLPLPGARLAWYYLLVTAATVVGLIRCVLGGPPLVWEHTDGTR
jgi:cellulose synthase/poly-beta-1,6-N-acetylglucosamine synthase-like glycosyltransferase